MTPGESFRRVHDNRRRLIAQREALARRAYEDTTLTHEQILEHHRQLKADCLRRWAERKAA